MSTTEGLRMEPASPRRLAVAYCRCGVRPSVGRRRLRSFAAAFGFEILTFIFCGPGGLAAAAARACRDGCTSIFVWERRDFADNPIAVEACIQEILRWGLSLVLASEHSEVLARRPNER